MWQYRGDLNPILLTRRTWIGALLGWVASPIATAAPIHGRSDKMLGIVDTQMGTSSSSASNHSVSSTYVHRDKIVKSSGRAVFHLAQVKLYDIAMPGFDIPVAISSTAGAALAAQVASEHLILGDEMGFVILHRCERNFYFLILSIWRNDNELWETVYAKRSADTDFSLFDMSKTQRGTYCVWEMAVVWHERQAWRRFLRSARTAEDRSKYLDDKIEGLV